MRLKKLKIDLEYEIKHVHVPFNQQLYINTNISYKYR